MRTLSAGRESEGRNGEGQEGRRKLRFEQKLTQVGLKNGLGEQAYFSGE